ncbi:hypothetical protein EG68_00677 [Paragonimus skrjabini miyazakii]|uniref:Uncharacterized protein n=1 Tax=Paragonimus skrjabini miyazakii TaxID=59628 RepID=A0A8S9Z3M8_9TREM|nr:hypothetical protein EG68_00677 [Paragonimus skrjabini miyazakii]
MHVIFALLFGFLIPGLVNCVFQFRVLLSIYRLTATEPTSQTATNSTGHSDASLINRFDPNITAITIATVIMNVNYFLSRIYPQLQHLLLITQALPRLPMRDWENPLIFPFGCVNYYASSVST